MEDEQHRPVTMETQWADDNSKPLISFCLVLNATRKKKKKGKEMLRIPGHTFHKSF